MAAPAGAAAPAGGAVVPTIAATYNTGEILFTDPPANPTTVTVTRGAATIATGTFNAPDPAAPGEFGVNSFHLGLAGTATGCWNSFTPQILPGDVITVAGQDPITVPDIAASAPTVENGAVAVHGSQTGVDPSLLDVEIAPQGLGKFAGGIGSAGGQFLSSLTPRGFAAVFSMDPGSATNWTTRFSGLDAGSQAIASNGVASVVYDPFALAAVDPAVATTVGYEAAATPGAAPGCATLYRPNEAQSASRSLINAANAGSDLTVSGVSQPGASAVNVALIDRNGQVASAPAFGAGAWSATIPASSLANLADGPIKVASNYSIGAGKTVSGLLSKDTTAPDAPTANLAAGTYSAAQSVALSAAEGTIRYTTDGTDPTANSPKYANAISVATSQTVKAIAIDAAGNTSPVAAFGYTIARPTVAVPAPKPAPSTTVPKLRLDALTIGTSYSLRTVRAKGLRAVIFAPEGAKVVKIRLLLNNHVITRTTRVVRGDGVLTVTLPSTKKGRKKLRRGTYKLQVTPGTSPNKYGATTTRTIRIR